MEIQCDQSQNAVQGDRSDCDKNEYLESEKCAGIQNIVNEISRLMSIGQISNSD